MVDILLHFVNRWIPQTRIFRHPCYQRSEAICLPNRCSSTIGPTPSGPPLSGSRDGALGRDESVCLLKTLGAYRRHPKYRVFRPMLLDGVCKLQHHLRLPYSARTNQSELLAVIASNQLLFQLFQLLSDRRTTDPRERNTIVGGGGAGFD